MIRTKRPYAKTPEERRIEVHWTIDPRTKKTFEQVAAQRGTTPSALCDDLGALLQSWHGLYTRKAVRS